MTQYKIWLCAATVLVAAPAFAAIASSFDPKVTAGRWTHGTLYSTTPGIAGLQELEDYFLQQLVGLIVPDGPCRILPYQDSSYQYIGVCNRLKLGGGGAPTVAYYLRCNQGETFNSGTGVCICPPPNEVFVVPSSNSQICGPVLIVDKTRKKPSVCYGNPMLPLVGAKREPVPTGLSVAGVEWVLTYDSTSASAAQAPSDEGPPALGRLWFSTFHRRLAGRRRTPTSTPIGYRAYRGDGTVVSFPNFDRDVTDTVGFIADGEVAYFDSRSQAIEVYGSADGLLRRIVFTDGRLIRFTYSTASTPAAIAPAPGYLLRAEDRFGRGIDFEYLLPFGSPPASGALVRRALRAGVPVATLLYDTAFNLAHVTWADGRRRSFVYEDARWPWALTGVIDERGVRFSRFGYDDAGRIQSTEHAGGVERFSVAYGSPPRVEVTESVTDNVLTRTYAWVAPVDPVVTLPNGSTTRLGVTTRFGQPLVTSRTQSAGFGCDAATSATTFDANAFVVSEDDFNGHRTCSGRLNAYSHFRVEGLPAGTDCTTVGGFGAVLPPPARRITTETLSNGTSHVRRIAEPNRITTYVFNGESDPTRGNVKTWCAPSAPLAPGLFGLTPLLVICRVVEQATTDTMGTRGFSATLDPAVPARVTTYTYNEAGQVLSEDGPRTDVVDVTTFSYYADTTAEHMVGDPYQVTTPTGQTTTYLVYGTAGEVLSTRDANGVVARSTYDARLRLIKTSDFNGEQYQYDATGRLSTVSPPAWAHTYLRYDAAGRLTGFSDQRSNSVTFVLDAAGRVIRRDVRDSIGEVVRTGSREYDALGRVGVAKGEVLR